MKTQFIFRIAAALLFSFSVSSSFGQVITTVDTLPTVYIYSYSVVNNEVHKAFKRDFKDAVNPRWYTMDQNFLVKFISKDQKNHVLYNKKGAIIYHIAYGNEQTMPKDVLALVKSKYPADDIVNVIDVNQDQRNIWVIPLKEKGDLVSVRVEDGQLDEVDRVHDASM